jgi:hypothetical protein
MLRGLTNMRHGALASLLVLSACGPALTEIQPIGEPIVYEGRVVAARGPTMTRAGETCTVEIRATDTSTLNCRIRVRCSGDLVYGLSGSGYNQCRQTGERFVFAHDHSGTRRDGDPRMFFDLEAARVIVSDDDPDVEVLVDLIRQPVGYAEEVH